MSNQTPERVPERLTEMLRRVDWRGAEADLRNLLAEAAGRIDALETELAEQWHASCGCIGSPSLLTAAEVDALLTPAPDGQEAP